MCKQKKEKPAEIICQWTLSEKNCIENMCAHSIRCKPNMLNKFLALFFFATCLATELGKRWIQLTKRIYLKEKKRQ